MDEQGQIGVFVRIQPTDSVGEPGERVPHLTIQNFNFFPIYFIWKTVETAYTTGENIYIYMYLYLIDFEFIFIFENETSKHETKVQISQLTEE